VNPRVGKAAQPLGRTGASASAGLRDYFQVDTLVFRYYLVNFRADKNAASPNGATKSTLERVENKVSRSIGNERWEEKGSGCVWQDVACKIRS
jgi:hypothetical protein